MNPDTFRPWYVFQKVPNPMSEGSLGNFLGAAVGLASSGLEPISSESVWTDKVL